MSLRTFKGLPQATTPANPVWGCGWVQRGVGAASGQARVVSEQVDAGGVLTSKSRRPKAKAGVAAEAATDDGAQLSDGARTLLDWMLGAHARRTYETSPLGAMHAAAPVAAQATLFDSPPAPTSPTKPALPGRPGDCLHLTLNCNSNPHPRPQLQPTQTLDPFG
jgi:hypothetical protein